MEVTKRADMGTDPREARAAGIAAFFRAERWRIGLTYGVTLLENLFYLLYPWTIGLCIDGLLAGNGLWSLMPLAVIWGLHIVVGAARQVYATWVFARIHAQIATDTIARQRVAGVGTTHIAARSVMSRELVDFFEREVPTIVTAGLGLWVGSPCCSGTTAWWA
jgi:ABC-type multidrug transport system fused ATPase/permease subunit